MTTSEVKVRQMIEKAIVEALVDSLLKAGKRVSVSLEKGYDISDCLLGSTDKKTIMDEAFAGDECHLFVHNATGPLIERGRMNDVGWFYLVFGNEGWDVVSDYALSVAPFLDEAERISKLAENGDFTITFPKPKRTK